MGFAEIGATPKGGVRRLTLTDVDKRGRDRFRAGMRGAGPDRPGRRDRQHVRPPPRARPEPAAGAVRQPSRQPAERRKVRRRAGGARRAGGHAQPERPGHRHRGAAGADQLDGRGRQPVRPQPDGVRRLGGRFRPGQGVRADRHRGRDGRNRAGRHRLPRRRNRPRRSRRMRISSCISSRGRSWSARTNRSASSPARRRRFGTMR